MADQQRPRPGATRCGRRRISGGRCLGGRLAATSNWPDGVADDTAGASRRPSIAAVETAAIVESARCSASGGHHRPGRKR